MRLRVSRPKRSALRRSIGALGPQVDPNIQEAVTVFSASTKVKIMDAACALPLEALWPAHIVILKRELDQQTKRDTAGRKHHDTDTPRCRSVGKFQIWSLRTVATKAH